MVYKAENPKLAERLTGFMLYIQRPEALKAYGGLSKNPFYKRAAELVEGKELSVIKENFEHYLSSLEERVPKRLRRAYVARARLSLNMLLREAYVFPKPFKFLLPYLPYSSAVAFRDDLGHRYIILKLPFKLPRIMVNFPRYLMFDSIFQGLAQWNTEKHTYLMVRDVIKSYCVFDRTREWPNDRSGKWLFDVMEDSLWGLQKGEVIVDLGAGVGNLVRYLLEEGYKPLGTTICPLEDHKDISHYLLYSPVHPSNIDRWAKSLEGKLFSLYSSKADVIFDYAGILHYASFAFSVFAFSRLLVKLYDLLNDGGVMVFLPSTIEGAERGSLLLKLRRPKAGMGWNGETSLFIITKP